MYDCTYVFDANSVYTTLEDFFDYIFSAFRNKLFLLRPVGAIIMLDKVLHYGICCLCYKDFSLL